LQLILVLQSFFLKFLSSFVVTVLDGLICLLRDVWT